jgi:hypothetical protein
MAKKPAMVRSAAPRSSSGAAFPNGGANGHSPPTTPLDVGSAAQPQVPAPFSPDTRPAREVERAAGGIDMNTIRSLKETIESLLRDLNKAITERDTAVKEVARLEAAAQNDHHGEFLRLEVKALRDNKKELENALHAAVQEHKQELQHLRQRFVDEMERSVQDKSVAIDDIEKSYSEALRAAQARTSEAREENRKANDRSEILTRDLEAVRTQLRQVEQDRAFQVSTLEDERRQFNRFREDALKKHADLTDTKLEIERLITQTETKLRAAQMELAAQKLEHERASDKMRQEIETLMQSRDTARSQASSLRRDLDSTTQEILDWKRAAAKLERELREVIEAKKSSDAAAAAMQDKLAMVESARAQELDDLQQIKTVLAAYQREHAATQERAKSRLEKVRDAVPEYTLPSTGEQTHGSPQEEEAPVALKRKENSRATRAAAPLVRAPTNSLPPPVATGEGRAADGGGGGEGARPAPAPSISPSSSSSASIIGPPAVSQLEKWSSSVMLPSPPPAPETGKGWFPEQRKSAAASQDASKGALLPRAGTQEEGALEDVFLEAEVLALVDIYVVSARDVPKEHLHRQMHVHIRMGRQSAVTRGIASAEGADGRASRAWHSNFRCASSDPQNDILIFDMEVLLEEGEEAKGSLVMMTPDGRRWDQVGRVAVPLSRVLVTGKEAGWYEVRSLKGAPIFTSPDVPFRLQIGCAAATVRCDPVCLCVCVFVYV